MEPNSEAVAPMELPPAISLGTSLIPMGSARDLPRVAAQMDPIPVKSFSIDLGTEGRASGMVGGFESSRVGHGMIYRFGERRKRSDLS